MERTFSGKTKYDSSKYWAKFIDFISLGYIVADRRYRIFAKPFPNFKQNFGKFYITSKNFTPKFSMSIKFIKVIKQLKYLEGMATVL